MKAEVMKVTGMERHGSRQHIFTGRALDKNAIDGIRKVPE